jgi:nitrogen regulatory protein PII
MKIKQQNCKILALFTIVDYSVGCTVSDLFLTNGVSINLLTHGHGAANAEIYDLLGFGEPKKAIIISVLTEPMAHHILKSLRTEINLNKPGTGIAFTVPINGISSALSQLCSFSEAKVNCESEGVPMTQNEPYDLIITIVNNGYFSQVMEVATAAGANGGTLIHGRGLTTQEATKFLGITIQPEKDIVMILAPHDKKQTIMENIIQEVGLSTAGKGICFSLPVSTALGLGTHSIS